ncbi:MAG: Gfo/Idh/MocA family oxidoreductase [Promethearchaeota archaeon]|nr:MAG: Gfo/Idh/MocA family oxidoreductase [Candidatus Lokiarchaeota archaeon]
MDKVVFGIAGLGGAWNFHSAGIKNNSKIEIGGAFDINQRSLKQFKRRYKTDIFSDYDEFLKSEIDAVLIMVPHYLHKDFVVKAAEASKHILCEKPMARTLEECDEMIDAARRNKVKLMIAENHRFLPAHQYIHDVVQEESLLGEIFLIRAYEGVNEISGLTTPNFWKGDPIKAGGGALMDMGTHKFATINWILEDKIESAYCTLAKLSTQLLEKAEDNAISVVKYKKGTMVNITVSFSVISPPTNSLEIYGTKGTLIENHMWKNPVKINSYHDKMKINKGKWHEPDIEHSPFPGYYQISSRIEDDHFIDCILNDSEPEFAPEDAKRAVADVLLNYLSARRKTEINFNDLLKIYNSEGTYSIIDGLEKFI